MLYHNSSNKILEFIPKKFFHSEDFLISGSNNGKKNKNLKSSELVFASDLFGASIYCLPRNIPRIILSKEYNQDTIDFLKLDDFNNIFMILDAKNKNSLDSHSWFEHQFSNENFELINDGIFKEYIAKVKIKPIKIIKRQNPIKFLKKIGWTVIYVSDIQKLNKILKTKRLIFDSESL
jgi:hypothetical protein